MEHGDITLMLLYYAVYNWKNESEGNANYPLCFQIFYRLFDGGQTLAKGSLEELGYER